MAPVSPQQPGGGHFWDDDGNVHEGWIEAIFTEGITNGCGGDFNDLYCPDRAVTRGQMAAFLVRALDLPPAAVSDRFTDDDTSAFEREIDAVAAAGITRGCNPPANDRYCPDDAMRRGQTAAFLVRALDLPPAAVADRFADDDTSVFETDIDAVAAAGITLGCDAADPERYCPDSAVRRDQMAAFLGRALGLTGLMPPRRPAVTTAFTGDLLLNMPVNAAASSYGASSGRAYDFRPMFEPVATILSTADLAICHLEVPLSPTSTGLSGYPTFLAPAELADAIAGAGYDGCSVASNHSYDRSRQGVLDTLSVLDSRQIGYAGMSASAADRAEPTIYVVDAVAVAHLSYTYSLNGLVLPPNEPWLVNLIDESVILADASAARGAGADVVIVSLHWGAEYRSMPTSTQDALGRALISSDDVDLVVGHHAHVVQPLEKVGSEYIAYGLGNFLSNQRSNPFTQDGVIISVEFALRGERMSARSVTYTPTWVESGSYRILPAAETIQSGAAAAWVLNALEDSWYRTHAAIGGRFNDAAASAWP